MAATSKRSRIEPAARTTAKPIASPRAESHKAASAPKTAAKTARSKSRPTSLPRKDSNAAEASRPTAGKSDSKAKVVDSKLSFKGKVFSVYTDTVIEPGADHPNTRDVIRHNGSVVVIAVDDSTNPDDPDIILEKQYRHAAGQFLIELPAGTRDPGEAPLAAAKRELIEETGYRARKWTMLVKYFASPGFLGEWMQIYLAQEIRPGKAQPEHDEKLEIFKMPLSEVMEMIADGKIHDGKTLIGLSLYDVARRDGRLG